MYEDDHGLSDELMSDPLRGACLGLVSTVCLGTMVAEF